MRESEPGSRSTREAIDGDEVTFRVARPAHRIVSQYWSLDEFAYSILPAEDVVAVSESAYLEEISNVLANVKRFNPCGGNRSRTRGRAGSRSDAGINQWPCRLHQPRSQFWHPCLSHADYV